MLRAPLRFSPVRSSGYVARSGSSLYGARAQFRRPRGEATFNALRQVQMSSLVGQNPLTRAPTRLAAPPAVAPHVPARSQSTLVDSFFKHVWGATPKPTQTQAGADPQAAAEKPQTARPEMPQARIEELLESGEHKGHVAFRTPSADVAQNQALRFTGQSNRLAKEGVYFGPGLEGFNYGSYHVVIPRSQTDARPNVGRPEEYLSQRGLDAAEGHWFHNDTLKKAKDAVAARRKAGK